MTSFTLQKQRVPCVTTAHDYSAARTCAVQEKRQLEGTHGPDKAKQQQRIVKLNIRRLCILRSKYPITIENTGGYEA